MVRNFETTEVLTSLVRIFQSQKISELWKLAGEKAFFLSMFQYFCFKFFAFHFLTCENEVPCWIKLIHFNWFICYHYHFCLNDSILLHIWNYSHLNFSLNYSVVSSGYFTSEESVFAGKCVFHNEFTYHRSYKSCAARLKGLCCEFSRSFGWFQFQANRSKRCCLHFARNITCIASPFVLHNSVSHNFGVR